MDLDSAFTVTAPIDQVWSTLMDFEEVAGCVPGAQVLNKLSDDAYQVGMKVKLGPVTMQYKGQMEVIERDEKAYRAVLKGSAKEARGQGTAQATAHLQLVEEGSTVHADVALSGRAAAMGQGVIGSVTDQMMGQFATNLQAMLASDGAGAAVAASAAGAGAGAATAAAGPEAAVSNGAGVASANGAAPSGGAGSGGSSAEARPSDERSSGSASTNEAATESSLDVTALGLSLVKAQLQEPGRALQVVALVALVAYRLGLRSGRRERLRWLGPVSG